MAMTKRVLVIFLLLTPVVQAQGTTLFEQGKEAYKNGNFQEAATLWSQIVEGGSHSASVYYNLGNAHYKLNQIGPSIYYYEKALQLAPNDGTIKNNLAFAENARVDLIEPLPQPVFKKWYNSVSGVFNFDGWAWLCVGFSMLFTVLFLAYCFFASERKKRLFFAGSLISVVLFLGAFAMAFTTHNDVKNNTPAIVFSESASVKSEPRPGSDNVFTLHEGTKVQVTATDGAWVRIQLADGKDGWLPKTDVKQL
ncbi:MAG: tetratricopeptide repeat protein [Marinirhabdus sp.]